MTSRPAFWRAGLSAVALVLAFRTPAVFGRQAGASSAAASGLVVVDFEALQKDGTPVIDLKPEQITLKIDGKTREIRSLEVVKLENSITADPNAPVPPPAPYGTNVLEHSRASRAVIVVIEDETLLPGKEAAMRQALAQLVARLGPQDRISLVTVPHGGMKVDFTTDHAKFLSELAKVGGLASLAGADSDPYCRTRNTLQAVTGLLDDLAVGAAGPTTVVFFTNSLMGATSAPQLIQGGRAGQANPSIGTCQLQILTFQQLGDAAAAARANFYLVQPDDTGSTSQTREGIENVAGVTGGKRLSVDMASELALSRLSTESSAYYLATFAPEPNERNGLPHHVEVKIARDGVSASTRMGIVIPKPGNPATAMPPAGKPPTAMPMTMIREPRAFRELPLRVSGFTSRNGAAGAATTDPISTGAPPAGARAGAAVKIVALLEGVDQSTSFSGAAAGLFDSSGKLVGQWAATPNDLQRPWIIAAILAPPGTYRLRMSATDATGRGGAADTEVDAQLVDAGGLKLSSIVLGLSRNNGFVPKLQFGGEAVAIGQFELYGRVSGQISALLEIAQTLNGPALTSMPLAVGATEEPDRFLVRGALPIGALPTGDYVVRGIVAVPGQPAGRVVRTLRKTSM